MPAPPDPEIARWLRYLRYDPTRWLLETNDPSILLWVQLDIANRPEDARGVVEMRERVLYSEPVQAILSAQDELGLWGDMDTPALPYRGTIWNLALLAELGIPRASRRARRACAMLLETCWQEDGTFRGVDAVAAGYLVRAFAYFNMGQDERVIRSALALEQKIKRPEEAVCALWAWRELQDEPRIAAASELMLERVLNLLGYRNAGAEAPAAYYEPLTFPQFAPDDMLFLLRVLAEHGRIADARAAPLVAALAAKQDERARWTLERDLNAELITPLERAGEPSRWVTLNAVRVIKQLLGAG